MNPPVARENALAVMFGVQDAARVGIVMGIMTIIFGMLSLMAPGLAGVGINIIAAVALIATGMARLVFAFKADSFGSGVLVFLFGEEYTDPATRWMMGM